MNRAFSFLLVVLFIVAAPACSKKQLPHERYEAYKAAVLEADNFSQLSDYFTEENNAKLAAGKKDDLEKFLKFEKALARDWTPQLESEEITGSSAVITYKLDVQSSTSGGQAKTTGNIIVRMQQESGKWKIKSDEIVINEE